MPNFQHGKSVVIYLDAYDLSAYFKKASSAQQAAKADTTTFQSTDESSLPGIKNGTVTLDGYWSADAGGTHAVLSALIAVAQKILTIGQALSIIGNPATLVSGYEAKYQEDEDIGSAIGATCEFISSGGLFYGVFQHANQAETVTGNSASVDNTAATANGFVANQHVLAITGAGATLTGKIQDSADNTTFADLAGGGFAAATAVGAQQIVGSGTVRRYTREVHTISGTTPSITYVTALARK